MDSSLGWILVWILNWLWCASLFEICGIYLILLGRYFVCLCKKNKRGRLLRNKLAPPRLRPLLDQQLGQLLHQPQHPPPPPPPPPRNQLLPQTRMKTPSSQR